MIDFHKHTHTHTHTYIHIYIYIYSCSQTQAHTFFSIFLSILIMMLSEKILFLFGFLILPFLWQLFFWAVSGTSEKFEKITWYIGPYCSKMWMKHFSLYHSHRTLFYWTFFSFLVLQISFFLLGKKWGNLFILMRERRNIFAFSNL